MWGKYSIPKEWKTMKKRAIIGRGRKREDKRQATHAVKASMHKYLKK
jgi:hypothetical protein